MTRDQQVEYFEDNLREVSITCAQCGKEVKADNIFSLANNLVKENWQLFGGKFRCEKCRITNK